MPRFFVRTGGNALGSRACQLGCLIARSTLNFFYPFILGVSLFSFQDAADLSRGQQIQEICRILLEQFALLRSQLLQAVPRFQNRKKQFARQLTPPRHSMDNAVSRNLYRRYRERSRSRALSLQYCLNKKIA